ncbi:uncharacterized protein LOC135923675 isoform X1 [Gordionus sp. m RMFG-2023]|uniref:uncharacterized protein LOC135923675 isoform X1 n=1 Tax=Gordionus sp. m RMFG-2023 TaxID=3053472 RepID=UPI0031FCEBB2
MIKLKLQSIWILLLISFLTNIAEASNLIVIHKPTFLDIKIDVIQNINKFIMNLYGIFDDCNCEEPLAVEFKYPFIYPCHISLSISYINTTFQYKQEIDHLHNILDYEESNNKEIIEKKLKILKENLKNIRNINQLNESDFVFVWKNNIKHDNLPDLLKNIIDIQKDLKNSSSSDFIELVLLLTSDHHQRSIREVVDENIPPQDVQLMNIKKSLTQPTPQKYSAIFNIIFWTSLILALTVYVLVVSLWHVDPGKDSIIYRITNPRYKKDL